MLFVYLHIWITGPEDLTQILVLSHIQWFCVYTNLCDFQILKKKQKVFLFKNYLTQRYFTNHA